MELEALGVCAIQLFTSPSGDLNGLSLISDHKGTHFSWAATPDNLPTLVLLMFGTFRAPPCAMHGVRIENQCFLRPIAGE